MKNLEYDNWKLRAHMPAGKAFTLASGLYCSECGDEIPSTQTIEGRREKFIPMVGSDYKLRVYFYKCLKHR
jgi:hypothetical protein